MIDNLLDEFSIEATELLDDSEDTLMGLESNESLEDAYKVLFRNFHTLKGSSGMMGLDDLQHHMHLIEDRLQSFEDTKEKVKENLDYFLLAVDVAREVLKGNRADFDYNIGGSSDEFDDIINLKGGSQFKHVIVIDEGRKNSKDIIEALGEYDVLCFPSVNKLKEAGDISGKIIITKEAQLDDIKSLDTDDSVEVILWGTSLDMPCWNEGDSKESLRTIVDSLISKLIYKENFNKSLTLVLYQLSDLEEFLEKNNKSVVLKTLKTEVAELIKVKRTLG